MNNQPTIVFIITQLEFGGAQKVCLRLFKDLKAQGFNTILMTSAIEGPLSKEIEPTDTVIYLQHLKRSISIASPINEWISLKEMYNHLHTIQTTSNNPLIIHTHSSKAGILGRWAAFFAGIKNRVHTIHGYAFHEFQNSLIFCIWYFLELLTSFITTQYITVSETDRAIGNRLFPRFQHSSCLIRAAMHIPQRKSIPLIKSNNETIVIGAIACFKPQKNVPDLIRAFALLYHQHPNVRLEIIGDGELRNDIEHLIQYYHITQQVLLHGWQKSVTKIMKYWDIYASTALWEGLPCAIVEARQLKLPVITYDVGGIRDIIKHEKNGLLIPPHMWDTFAQGLHTLALNTGLRLQLAHYSDDLGSFMHKSMVESHASLYQKLINPKAL